jgi:hypothetical protein
MNLLLLVAQHGYRDGYAFRGRIVTGAEAWQRFVMEAPERHVQAAWDYFQRAYGGPPL